MNLRYGLIALHIVFWVLNYLYITSGNLGWNGFDNSNETLSLAYTYGIVFNAALFYIQVFWLVPRYYIRSKKGLFWLLSLLFLLLLTSIETALDLQVAAKFEVYKGSDFPLYIFAIPWFYHNVIFHTLYSLTGFFYQFFFEYRRAENAKKELLQETHKSELKYLKAQLNPHFLFNGINSVYHLIGKNNPRAKETLMQFSGLLRYQLYESSEAFIRLEKELDYVTQFIRMEAVRKGDDIDLSYHINYENASQKIAPLLMTPFIENAFKHVSHHDASSENKISINIAEMDQYLELEVSNTCDAIPEKQGFGGVGLTNVKRRLELLYPEKHQLEIVEMDSSFLVNLKIDLS
ncbi:MAG: histidine kinase [Bacteroidota bacterium]